MNRCVCSDGYNEDAFFRPSASRGASAHPQNRLVSLSARRQDPAAKPPTLVRQEFYGPIMAHIAVRGLMHEAALKADEAPDRLSFLHAVRVWSGASCKPEALFPPR
jgi:hypothetical protein